MTAPDGTRVWIVRHGESILNSLMRVQGWCDAPLTAAGIEQAKVRARDFRDAGVLFTAAISGDGIRHRQTLAHILSEQQNPPALSEDIRWREIGFGWLEGAHSRKLQRWMEAGVSEGGSRYSGLDALAASPKEPRAEAPATVVARTLAALDDIAAGEYSGDVLVVTSGLTVMLLLDALGADLSHIARGPANLAASSLVRRDGAWVVERAVVDALNA